MGGVRTRRRSGSRVGVEPSDLNICHGCCTSSADFCKQNAQSLQCHFYRTLSVTIAIWCYFFLILYVFYFSWCVHPDCFRSRFPRGVHSLTVWVLGLRLYLNPPPHCFSWLIHIHGDGLRSLSRDGALF